jgi:hypothetical protein
MKKLYEIKVDAIAYAIGETSLEAQKAFEEEVTFSDLMDMVETTDAVEVESVIDASWEKSYPYGTSRKDSLTCGDWLKNLKIKREAETKRKEFETKQRKLWEKP